MEGKKIPDAVKTRVTETLCETLFESDEKLKEAFEAKVKAELEYVNKFSKKGAIDTGAGSEGTENKGLMEGFEKDLVGRAGVEEEKKDKDEE